MWCAGVAARSHAHASQIIGSLKSHSGMRPPSLAAWPRVKWHARLDVVRIMGVLGIFISPGERLWWCGRRTAAACAPPHSLLVVCMNAHLHECMHSSAATHVRACAHVSHRKRVFTLAPKFRRKNMTDTSIYVGVKHAHALRMRARQFWL